MDGGTARLQAVKLSTYLDETTELFEAIALKKDITLTQIADESIIIKADPDMLQLVIRNLLNNAVKFTPNCGKIELKAVISDANCIISITDNGIGIPLGKQGEIFSLNVTSTTGTHNEKGTGLGLVLCKDYTELQGGRIWFTSVVGQGSTFYISLPLVQLSLFTA
jgi:two-component system sensor histidine kinase/response regulator